MKLTDFLEDIGRPVAYYPSMRKITGSTNATVLLCQFIYWRDKQSDPDGWLFKTSEEVKKETGLTYEEQKHARKQLKDAGFLEEHYARLDHQMNYRLNLEAINEAWATREPSDGEQGKASLGKEGIPFSLNSNTENTTEKSLSPADLKEANRQVDEILKMNEQAREKQEQGFWEGRDLVPSHLLIYADWWNAQTGQSIKGKLNKEWAMAFTNWMGEGLTLSSLQEAFETTKAWKKIIAKPSEITATAVAIQALPKVNHTAEPVAIDEQGIPESY